MYYYNFSMNSPSSLVLSVSKRLVGPFLGSLLASSPVFADDQCPDVPNSFVDVQRWQTSHDVSGVIADPVYATDRNFTGARVDGYLSEKVWIAPAVIERLTTTALSSVQTQLEKIIGSERSRRFRFIVKDGYRPHRATDAFVEWGRAHHLSGGWVASGISGHNRGYTVDLTLGYINDAGIVQEVWMGATFDEFNSNSNHGMNGRPVASTDQRLSYDDPVNAPHDGYIVFSDINGLQLRNALKLGMQTVGFSSYGQEYWHYTMSGYSSAQCYDRPIQ